MPQQTNPILDAIRQAEAIRAQRMMGNFGAVAPPPASQPPMVQPQQSNVIQALLPLLFGSPETGRGLIEPQNLADAFSPYAIGAGTRRTGQAIGQGVSNVAGAVAKPAGEYWSGLTGNPMPSTVATPPLPSFVPASIPTNQPSASKSSAKSPKLDANGQTAGGAFLEALIKGLPGILAGGVGMATGSPVAAGLSSGWASGMASAEAKNEPYYVYDKKTGNLKKVGKVHKGATVTTVDEDLTSSQKQKIASLKSGLSRGEAVIGREFGEPSTYKIATKDDAYRAIGDAGLDPTLFTDEINALPDATVKSQTKKVAEKNVSKSGYSVGQQVQMGGKIYIITGFDADGTPKGEPIGR